VLTQCPVCAAELRVTRLTCDGCGTAIEGRFGLGRFARLSRAELQFAEAFLKCRGKIKDVEQELGVSYPTVIARLDQLVAAMGFEDRASEPAPPAAQRILDELAAGTIDPAAAAARLRALKQGEGS